MRYQILQADAGSQRGFTQVLGRHMRQLSRHALLNLSSAALDNAASLVSEAEKEQGQVQLISQLDPFSFDAWLNRRCS